MANAFTECSYCGQKVLLPNVQPSTTLDADQVRLLLDEFAVLLSAQGKGDPCVSLEQELIDVQRTLETMHREFLEAERSDNGTV